MDDPIRRARAAPLLAALLPTILLPAALLLAAPARAQPADALNADPGTGAVKVCSPLAMPRWRSMIPAPKTWTYVDCMGFAGEMGADHFQLGCLFADVTPYAKKYAWGDLTKIDKAALAGPHAPIPNCGW